MPYAQKPPPIPQASAPFVDPKTGVMNPVWYQFLIRLVAWIAAGP
jgi:hypothetical protein